MSTKPSAGRVHATYEFVKAHRGEQSVQMMCRVLGVAPSGYYDWQQLAAAADLNPSPGGCSSSPADPCLIRCEPGGPRRPTLPDLREAGETCSKHRVMRLMRVNNLRALHGYRTRRWSLDKPSVLIPNISVAAVHGDPPDQGLRDLCHLHSDMAGLALFGRRHCSGPGRNVRGGTRPTLSWGLNDDSARNASGLVL